MPLVKKTSIVLCLVFFLIFSFGACKEAEKVKTDGKNSEKDKIVIGFSMDTLVHERWLRDRDIFMARAKELGAEVILQTANSDSAEQEKQVQYLLNHDIDVLVLVPHDAEKAAGIVHDAKSRGVKVISYDRLVKNANTDLYISFDNIRVGELMGQAALRNAPKGNYIIMNGSQSDNNSFMYNEGYFKALDKGLRTGDVKIVGQTWVKDWLYENALSYISGAIGTGENISAIIAANDTLAGAAIHVLAEKRLAGKITVVGHDADLDGCQRVVEGTQYATIYKPIDDIATKAAEFAINIAKGGLVQANSTINDGKYDVPFYKIDPILVTRENMVEVIVADHFHRLEDVYVNIPRSQWPGTK
jgi:D-xylose transport system substrate-binding protein